MIEIRLIGIQAHAQGSNADSDQDAIRQGVRFANHDSPDIRSRDHRLGGAGDQGEPGWGKPSELTFDPGRQIFWGYIEWTRAILSLAFRCDLRFL